MGRRKIGRRQSQRESDEELDRYSLDDVPRDLAFSPVVESRCSRIGVAGQVLDVFQRHSLTQQVGTRLVFRSRIRSARECRDIG